MANTIITKNSSTASAVPTSGDLVQGELAVNVTDKRLFTEDSGGTVVELGTNPSQLNFADNAKAIFGAGSDLQIYHDGTTNKIDGSVTLTGNLTTTGNTTLGDASTDTVTVNGYMGVGGAGSAGSGVIVGSSALTGTTQIGVNSSVVGSSAATTWIRGVSADPSTAAASFTVANMTSVYAANGGKGAGSTITNKHGLFISDQTLGTNNYGVTSQVSSGTDKWNIYASGTAANYFAGKVGVGLNSLTENLEVYGSVNSHYQSSNFNAGAARTFFDYVPSLSKGRIGVLNGADTSTETLAFIASTGTTNAEVFQITPTAFTVNEGGADIDFRVESDTNSHAFFLEGSSGNVGIGTSSPSSKLHLSGAATADARLTFTQTTAGLSGQIQQGSTGYAISALGSQAMLFETNGTERARITSAGDFLTAGKTSTSFSSAGAELRADGLATFIRDSSSATLYVAKPNTANPTGDLVEFRYNATVKVGSITYTASSVAYNTSSDYRLKEDWVAVADASTRVNALNPVNFAWKADGSRVDGFLAHEVAEVVPEAVTGEKDAVDDEGNPVYQGIDQSKLVPLLTAALQEALAEINALKARLDAANL